MPVDPIVGDLKAASAIINSNDVFLNERIIQESDDRDAATQASIRLEGDTFTAIPMLYGDVHTNPTGLDFNSGSPNFHYTTTGTVTIPNPTNMQADETQTGFIITQTASILWGTMYDTSYLYPTISFSYLWFNYVMLTEEKIAVALVEVII